MIWGEGTSIGELQNLSRTKREAKLDAIKDACTTYIQGPMTEALTALVAAAVDRTGLPSKNFQVRPDDDLASAEQATFALLPHDEMVDALRRDYGAMTAMIFGPVPNFDLLLQNVQRLEILLNAPEG